MRERKQQEMEEQRNKKWSRKKWNREGKEKERDSGKDDAYQCEKWLIMNTILWSMDIVNILWNNNDNFHFVYISTESPTYLYSLTHIFFSDL